ncbi:START domain-containing protein [Tanacetum coccineum]
MHEQRSTLWRSVTGFEDMKVYVTLYRSPAYFEVARGVVAFGVKHHEWDMPRGLRRLYTLKESSTSGDWRNNISASLIEGSSDEMLIKEVNINRSGSLVVWSTVLKKDFDLISNGKGVSEHSVLISGFSISTDGHTTATNMVVQVLHWYYGCRLMPMVTSRCRKKGQGGLSDGYKNSISEKELPDETYKEDGVALFRVQGSGPENMQAIQVEHVSLSMVLEISYIFRFKFRAIFIVLES